MHSVGIFFSAALFLGQPGLSAEPGAPSPFDPENLPESEEEIVERIRQHILATQKIEKENEMADYAAQVPKTGAAYSMIALPAGEVMIGSPEDEAGRLDDEGPQYKAKISPFWMGKFEVTWDEYEPFMIAGVPRMRDGRMADPSKAEDFAMLVSAPTLPYAEMSFGMGTKGYPAICMTHHAASKYCQWLSAQTGHFYRLPTEAEWEYACRAGTTSPYWYGWDPEKLSELEVIDPEQVRTGYEKIGTGKPNPWGFFDMHGNVLEWCLDGYEKNRLAALQGRSPEYQGKTVFEDPYILATTLYPRSARGGSWYDAPEICRSASRVSSHRNWKAQDPEIPKSMWHLTDAQWLGFRLVRPLKIPSAEEMQRIWNSGAVLE